MQCTNFSVFWGREKTVSSGKHASKQSSANKRMMVMVKKIAKDRETFEDK